MISKYQTFLPKIPHKDIFVWYQMAFLWAPNKTFCSIWNMSSVCWVQFKFTYSFILHSTFHKYKIRQPRSVSKHKLHAFVNIHSYEKNPLALKPSSNGACKERYIQKRGQALEKKTIRCLKKNRMLLEPPVQSAVAVTPTALAWQSQPDLDQKLFLFGRFLQKKD